MPALKQFLRRYGIVLILLLGLALRAAMVLQGQALPIRWDEMAYDDRAHHILNNLAGYDDVLRVPVYPFFLAFVYRVMGEARFVVGMVQALISTFMIAALYTLTRLMFGRKDMALLAALCAALYLEFLTLARILMSETLFMALSIVGVTVLLYAWKKGTTWQFIPAGMLLALAALTRELLSYFAVLVLPLWLAIASPKAAGERARDVGALALGLLVVFAPWVARNWSIEERFILATTHSETDLLRDNWRIELRAQNLPLRTSEGTMKWRVRHALEQVTGNQRSLFVLTRAAQTIWNYPIPWMMDKFTRLRNLWRPFALEARVVRLENVAQPWRNWLQGIVSYSAVALLLLGTLGMITARDDAPKLLIALYILYSLVIFLMTHYLPRFRLPLLIFLIPYAAFAVVRVAGWLRAPSARIFAKHPVRAFAAALVLGVFIVLARV